MTKLSKYRATTWRATKMPSIEEQYYEVSSASTLTAKTI